MKDVFLCFVENDVVEIRKELYHVILKAGLTVLPSSATNAPISKSTINKYIEQAECAVLCLGNKYGAIYEDTNLSITHYQYLECKKKCIENPKFKLFIWQPYPDELSLTDELFADLLLEFRNNIVLSISFNNINSSLPLVAELRVSLEEDDTVIYDTNETDIFLTYNQIDETYGENIYDLLYSILPIEKMNIIQDSNIDYSELCSQQIIKSKLAVVFFKESSEWAYPFTQQIWKKIGGASANTPILLIGGSENEITQTKEFNAPNVYSLAVSVDLAPIEIKVFYDKVIGN